MMVGVIAMVAVVGLGVGGYMYMNKPVAPKTTLDKIDDGGMVVEPTEAVLEGDAVGKSETNGVAKEFTIEASPYKFSVTEIRVKKGDTVRILVKTMKGSHDLVIDEFELATSQLAEGEEEEVEFVADRVGTFEYYCSVGNHRAMGMVGKLIVE